MKFLSLILSIFIMVLSFGCSEKGPTRPFLVFENGTYSSCTSLQTSNIMLPSGMVQVILKTPIDNPDTLYMPPQRDPEYVAAESAIFQKAKINIPASYEGVEYQVSGIYDFKVTHNGETTEVKDITYNGEDYLDIASGNGWKLYVVRKTFENEYAPEPLPWDRLDEMEISAPPDVEAKIRQDLRNAIEEYKEELKTNSNKQ